MARAVAKQMANTCLTDWEGDRKKNVTGAVKVFKKRSITLKKRVLTPTFYVIKWQWQTYSTRD